MDFSEHLFLLFLQAAQRDVYPFEAEVSPIYTTAPLVAPLFSLMKNIELLMLLASIAYLLHD